MRKVGIYGASVTYYSYTSDSKEGLVFWSSGAKEVFGASKYYWSAWDLVVWKNGLLK